MRNRIVCLLALAAVVPCLPAQTPAASDGKPPTEAPAQSQTAPPAAAATPAAPAAPTPAVEQNFTGNIEFGYRVIPNIDGSLNTYRSVVDLGEGPKLFGADATILNPNRRFFDRIDLHLTSLGDEPYQTAKLDIFKRNLYRLTVDWRDIAYFNFLPSYANVFRPAGSLLDANSFDTRIHNTDVRLDITPGSRFVPYL